MCVIVATQFYYIIYFQTNVNINFTFNVPDITFTCNVNRVSGVLDRRNRTCTLDINDFNLTTGKFHCSCFYNGNPYHQNILNI